jgi:hypothetical protein|tara:strand:+ start:3520 stop:3849 length:330 start_codon:yes stop_codon:yes gene_type:complete
MSKLLPTRLPISVDTQVTSDIFNRLVRILELNLGEIDPENIRQITSSERDSLNFNEGSIIWNTDIRALQVFKTTSWENISTPINPLGFELTISIGEVTVKTKGATTITL